MPSNVTSGILSELTDNDITVAQTLLGSGLRECLRCLARNRIEAAYWIDSGLPVVWPDGKLARDE